MACIFLAQPSFAQSKPNRLSLCVLQQRVTAGEHLPVEVAGVYSAGPDMGPLVYLGCATQYTWVEMALASNVNREKLRELLDHTGRAYVVLQGEFYGPGLPDPKLPDAIKRTYRPGWGHLGGFKTKLVVHYIRSARTSPSDHSKNPHQQ